MDKNKYIAIFDSGVGGLTALIHAAKVLPKENFLFFADTNNVPYGDKPIEMVRQLTLNAVANIMKYDVKAVVLACNTATSAASSDLRGKYPIPIIGMEPAIKVALQSVKNSKAAKRVLLLSTELTMKGEKLVNLLSKIDTAKQVDCIALSELVKLAENLDFSSYKAQIFLQEMILKYNFEHYGAIVLGCTHFIWYKELFEKLLPKHIHIIDGNTGTINYLKKSLEERNNLAENNVQRKILLHFTKQINPDHFDVLNEKIMLL